MYQEIDCYSSHSWHGQCRARRSQSRTADVSPNTGSVAHKKRTFKQPSSFSNCISIAAAHSGSSRSCTFSKPADAAAFLITHSDMGSLFQGQGTSTLENRDVQMLTTCRAPLSSLRYESHPSSVKCTSGSSGSALCTMFEFPPELV